MRYFTANYVKILGICKCFARDRVNGLGNTPRYGAVPKFSYMEIIVLGIAVEALHIDSEKYLFIVCAMSAKK